MLQPIAKELFNLCAWTIFVQICASGGLLEHRHHFCNQQLCYCLSFGPVHPELVAEFYFEALAELKPRCTIESP